MDVAFKRSSPNEISEKASLLACFLPLMAQVHPILFGPTIGLGGEDALTAALCANVDPSNGLIMYCGLIDFVSWRVRRDRTSWLGTLFDSVHGAPIGTQISYRKGRQRRTLSLQQYGQPVEFTTTTAQWMLPHAVCFGNPGSIIQVTRQTTINTVAQSLAFFADYIMLSVFLWLGTVIYFCCSFRPASTAPIADATIPRWVILPIAILGASLRCCPLSFAGRRCGELRGILQGCFFLGKPLSIRRTEPGAFWGSSSGEHSRAGHRTAALVSATDTSSRFAYVLHRTE